jgi:hypothetical protein
MIADCEELCGSAPRRPRIRWRSRGALAEWLGSGLQSRLQQFESARRLLVVRRLTLLAVLALALAACGGSGTSKDTLKITFGRSGGTLRPYSLTLTRDGVVATTGSPTVGDGASSISAMRARFTALYRRL